MAYPWPKHAVRQEMLLGGKRTLPGMAPDGTVDFGSVASGAPFDFVVCRGVFEIGADTTITRNIRFEQGGILRPINGARVEILGRIWADPTQHIFDISDGEVVGTFGNCTRSPCWWGAVADYAGPDQPCTNNYDAFVACAQASHFRLGVRSHVMVPAGDFFVEGPIRPAIENPAWGLPGQPRNLSEAGVIQLYIGDVWEGRGRGATYITIGNGTGGGGPGVDTCFVSLGGKDSSGPPTVWRNMFVGGEYGGAYAFTVIIGLWANGASLTGCWLTGASSGYWMSSTDQFVEDIVGEYLADGCRIQRGANNLRNATFYLCGNGIVHDPIDDQGETLISDVRINNRNGGIGNGYGVISTGLFARAKMVNVDVEAAPGGGEWVNCFAAYYAPGVQWVNCRAKVVGDHPAFVFAAAAEAQIVNCAARLLSGTSTSPALYIHSGSTSVSVTQFRSVGAFKDHIQVDTAGRDIKIIGAEVSGATRYGLRVLRCVHLMVTASSFVNNAEAGIYDRIAAGDGGTHLYNGIAADRGGAGNQAWGIITDINDVNGRFAVSGACSVLENGSGAINHVGAYNPANNNSKIKIGTEVLVA